MLTLKTNAFKYKDANGNMNYVGAVVGERTTDTSLSQAGVAADAQAVGNKLSKLSEQKVDKSNITLDKHTDGLIYIFVNGKPVGNGVEVTGEVVEGDVIGSLDEDNNILLSGDLANGTYTLKYLNEDGTYTDIGSLVVGEIPEPEPEKTNFADPTSSDWLVGWRISNGAPNGVQNDAEGAIATNYIPVEAGDIIVINNATTFNQKLSTYFRFAVYTGTSHNTRIYNDVCSSDNGYLNMLAENEFSVVESNIKYVRFTICGHADINEITINIKRNGEWL